MKWKIQLEPANDIENNLLVASLLISIISNEVSDQLCDSLQMSWQWPEVTAPFYGKDLGVTAPFLEISAKPAS